MQRQIGEIIANHRKNLGLTQEQLGEAVGVSGQAVSKWENGGIPDTLLLPRIAAVLGVTVDTLFGVEKKPTDMTEREVQDLLFRYCLVNGKKLDFFDFLFKAIWSMQTASLGNEVLFDLDEVIEKYADNPQITSQVINDSGTTYLSLVKNFPFFCAVKDTDAISDKLLAEKDFGEFFSLLADEDGRRAVIFTQTSTETSQYTAQGMAESMGIPQDKFGKILPLLVKYGLLNEDSLTLDGKRIAVYRKWQNPEIRPILMMAYQFMHARQCYYNFMCNRTKPYFGDKNP